MEQTVNHIQNPVFLQGGGEMGQLTRGYDWEQTTLGPIQKWPASLRTQLNLILNSRFPMLLFWGTDLITFYNDAFRPSLGNEGKHPSSLGQRGEESWAESWPTIGPMIYNIMAGGDAVWFEDQKLPIYREGKMDYAYWTYSFSPVTNDEETIGGVLVTCSETTKGVEALQKLHQANTHLKQSLDQNIFLQQQQLAAQAQTEENQRQLLASFENLPIGLAIMTGMELRIKVANPFYCMIAGRAQQALVGNTFADALPELAAQGFENLMRNVLVTGIPYMAKEVAVSVQRNNTSERLFIDHTFQPHRNETGTITGVVVVIIDVTQQVLSRRSIEDSEARFRSLIEEAPVGTCLYVGRELRIEVANEIILGYWGKTRSVIGKTLLEAIPEIADQPFVKILGDVFTTGKLYEEKAARAELIVNGSRGTYYFDVTYKPLHDATGAVYAVLDMAVDVTEQVLARQELEKSEKFARIIFHNSPVAKFVFEGEALLLREVNAQMLFILGRDAAIIGKPFLEVLPEFSNTVFYQHCIQVLHSGETHHENAGYIELLRNETIYGGYFDYTLKALRNRNGTIYSVICTFIDVTEQVNARQQLEEAEASLRGAIELADLATWNIDCLTGAAYSSERLRQWLGLGEYTGMNTVFNTVHEKDRTRIQNAIAFAMTPASGGMYEAEYTVVDQTTGQERILHAQGRTYFDAAGNALRMQGTAQDITIQREQNLALEREVQERTEQLAAINKELQIVNDELYTSNNQLSRSNEELAQYAYIASHDLQEPLRKIRMFSGILQTQEDMTQESKALMVKIGKATERMTELIRDLLEFSKLLNADILMQPVQLGNVAQAVSEDFELVLAEKKGRLFIAPLPVIEAVQLQMNQLFYNLIGNALKFTDPTRPPVIHITSRQLEPHEVRSVIAKPLEAVAYFGISVIDNGIGFEMQHADKIFEVFKRLHNREYYPGSGIGLALCRRIIANHKGHLSATSEPGNGATFFIVLPAQQKAEPFATGPVLNN